MSLPDLLNLLQLREGLLLLLLGTLKFLAFTLFLVENVGAFFVVEAAGSVPAGAERLVLCCLDVVVRCGGLA